AAGNMSGASRVSDMTPPTPPDNLTATTSTSGYAITLNWAAAADDRGVTGYRVERCKGTGGTRFTQIATTTGTTYSDMGLPPSTSYDYQVKAVDAAGNVSAASWVSEMTPPPPTVNGSSVAITVAPRATVSVGVMSGPGNPKDWLALYPTGTADTAWVEWFFLNGTKRAPASGLTEASVPFTMPSTLGDYEVRFFANNTFQRLGTTPAVTVAPPPPPTVPGSSVAITVAPGATVRVVLRCGPGNPKDWLALSPTGAADSAYLAWFFLNGTKSAPAAGLTTATIPFTL